MYLHLKEKEFKSFLQIIKERTNIDADIIEKDYYVLNDKYKVNIDDVKNVLKQIYNKVCK